MERPSAGQKFSVDILGLLDALTDQFPEPLLCVRELVQNAADAAARQIEVDVAYDSARKLFRLSVHDDGRGMNESEIDAYLTIGFSEKDPDYHRGRFGIGKLSPYALGISRMVVETSDGHMARRVTFRGDGSGTIKETKVKARGTVVRVYKECTRSEAEDLANRTSELVMEQCGSLPIPLFVNGQRVNREVGLPTSYSIRFSTPDGAGELGIIAEPIRLLMGGGIVLESGASILGPSISYTLDSSRLSPTLSRNAVRRDNAFDALLREAQTHTKILTEKVVSELRVSVDRLRKTGKSIERDLNLNDRAALEWLRGRLLNPEGDTPDPVIRNAPVLETADGSLVSAVELVKVIRKEGRLPISRVPRTREEIGGFLDRGVPVLLLYRDLEDFLESQRIDYVEVDGRDDGVEVQPEGWSSGEAALAKRIKPQKHKGTSIGYRISLGAMTLSLGLAAVWFMNGNTSQPQSMAPAKVLVKSQRSPDLEITHPTEIKVSVKELDKQRKRNIEAGIAVPSRDRSTRNTLLVSLTGLIAILSGAAGLAVLYFTLAFRPRLPTSWLQEELGTPLTVGESLRRRLDIVRRAVFHPIDFFIARAWSVKSAGNRSLSASSAMEHYRELNSEPIIRSGVRLDLDQIEIGFVDLISSVGEPHDGRMLLTRGHRALLNRNHPTIQHLIALANVDEHRARILLDILLATDVHLAKGTDPRQVEWDLLSRAERFVGEEVKA